MSLLLCDKLPHSSASNNIVPGNQQPGDSLAGFSARLPSGQGSHPLAQVGWVVGGFASLKLKDQGLWLTPLAVPEGLRLPEVPTAPDYSGAQHSQSLHQSQKGDRVPT